MLSGMAALLRLTITLNRLHLGARAADLIKRYDPATPVQALVNLNTFWPYT